MRHKMGAGKWISYILSGALIMTAAVLLGHLAAVEWIPAVLPTSSTGENVRPGTVFMIDAGHGGEDGGASSDTGILEKTLNLQIARTLSDIAGLFGYETVMTRSEDCMLYDLYGDLEDYTGYRKTYDLRNRLRMEKEW